MKGTLKKEVKLSSIPTKFKGTWEGDKGGKLNGKSFTVMEDGSLKYDTENITFPANSLIKEPNFSDKYTGTHKKTDGTTISVSINFHISEIKGDVTIINYSADGVQTSSIEGYVNKKQ